MQKFIKKLWQPFYGWLVLIYTSGKVEWTRFNTTRKIRKLMRELDDVKNYIKDNETNCKY